MSPQIVYLNEQFVLDARGRFLVRWRLRVGPGYATPSVKFIDIQLRVSTSRGRCED